MASSRSKEPPWTVFKVWIEVEEHNKDTDESRDVELPFSYVAAFILVSHSKLLTDLANGEGEYLVKSVVNAWDHGTNSCRSIKHIEGLCKLKTRPSGVR